MNEWISVKDRLPDPLIPVLAYDTQRIYLCYMPIDFQYNEHWNLCTERDCICTGCTGAVTHWIPLPEEPKQQP